MAVQIVAGEEFPGVQYGNANDQDYIIGSTPIVEILRVDDSHPARLVGVKYSQHIVGDPRGMNRRPDNFVRVTMLIAGGPWRQRMWIPDEPRSVEFLLHEPGDFIAWEPGAAHSWSPMGEATMLTVSFERMAKNAGVGE